MKITWLGHSAFRVEFGEARILIDPFLSGSPSFDG
ncbi:MAG TPA: MBL fold metallo-hydrolase, partial [Afifellaceae bacterium]|nr:MBL fold metallo-hydrolase [Afifellaceae bacterium]